MLIKCDNCPYGKDCGTGIYCEREGQMLDYYDTCIYIDYDVDEWDKAFTNLEGTT